MKSFKQGFTAAAQAMCRDPNASEKYAVGSFNSSAHFDTVFFKRFSHVFTVTRAKGMLYFFDDNAFENTILSLL